MGRPVHIYFNTSTTLRRILSEKILSHVRSSTSWKPDTEDTEDMKPRHLLPFAAAAVAAAALPDNARRPQAPMPSEGNSAGSLEWKGLPTLDEILTTLDGAVDYIGEAVLHAADAATRSGRRVGGYYGGSEILEVETTTGTLRHTQDVPRPSQKEGVAQSTNMSVIEIIQQSNQATYFARLLESYDELRDMFEDEERDFTVFVPTDEAFRNLEGFEKSEGALLGEILEYHVLEGRHPADKLREARTLPTVLEESELGGRRQRLRVAAGRLGVEVNFYGRVVDAESKEARNGVVHYIDSVLVPPPRRAALVNSLPEQLETFSRALEVTGWSEEPHALAQRGVTLFAPSNEAWERLGEDLRRFLFSDVGVEFLKALVRHHVAQEIVYTDVGGGVAKEEEGEDRHEVETMLGSTVSVDVDRLNGSRLVKVNGAAVAVRDVPARDGVVHIVDEVLLPPASETEDMILNGDRGQISMSDLKRRLGRYMEGGDGMKSEEL
ncbi:aurofusarin biosynthesis cluster protein S [Colletotrichum spaethianum]|uniref:Aurofusarin biosynthesis cluster protein S n=1 Tax=Colletotrichum spaethianum TaxID=700344 RepID=A0AA37L8I8_9PEZI|nr:aurofusarin biosynthesis cluster protein S [Colletotrichum spaethianum]GKT42639.1 aurofusarin biosynthesis cluster protein S [Colletotrichum spaethianum]